MGQQAALAAQQTSQTKSEIIQNQALLKEILSIFGTSLQHAAETENLELFQITIESLKTLQEKHKLFEKRIFKEILSDFCFLLIKSWQSGVANRVQDELASLLFAMVNVKGAMQVFVEEILPGYLNNLSG